MNWTYSVLILAGLSAVTYRTEYDPFSGPRDYPVFDRIAVHDPMLHAVIRAWDGLAPGGGVVAGLISLSVPTDSFRCSRSLRLCQKGSASAWWNRMAPLQHSGRLGANPQPPRATKFSLFPQKVREIRLTDLLFASLPDLCAWDPKAFRALCKPRWARPSWRHRQLRQLRLRCRLPCLQSPTKTVYHHPAHLEYEPPR